jgi:3-deoxy-D-manno-octulosonic-acid transferase
MATRGTLGRNWRQRFGLVRSRDLSGLRPGAERVWVHAVSAGETVAAAPVITELARLGPHADIVLSTTTPAGQKVAPTAAPAARATIYFPIDLLPSVAAALSAVRPQVCIQMETELWPNFLALAHRRGAFTAVVNGRVWRTARPGRLWRRLMGWTLAQVDLLCMQSEIDAERIIALGADRRRVLVTGNTKFDQADASGGEAAGEHLRSELGLGDGEFVLVAGSTHPGEEEVVLDGFRLIAAEHRAARLVIAPRHIERTPAVEALARERGFRVVRRSHGTHCDDTAVVLLDTMGELQAAYGLADVAFVGGSIAPIGGHSLLEPLARDRPTLFGPHMHKQADIARIAQQWGVGTTVRDASELAAEALRHLRTSAGSPGGGDDFAAKCRALFEANRGAARRAAEAISARVGWPAAERPG